MRIAVAANYNLGLNGAVVAHFERCSYYTLADVENEKVQDVKVINNPFYDSHSQQGESPASYIVREQVC